mmetsp:Transcript_10037/g.15281  ORF Transcript_10037/g.15281 Transcript_10037/m.15281 type:complete len:198 (+) Transcript_10037:2711-3304(+)
MLEIFQASERFFKKKTTSQQLKLQREVMTLEGKTPAEIDAELRKHQQYGLFASDSQKGEGQGDGSQSYSFVNIVFNYFNDSTQGDGSGENQEKIEGLRKKQKKLKNDQTENLKLMNELFNKFASCPKQAKDEKETTTSDHATDLAIDLLQKIVCALKDNLSTVAIEQDGIFCVLLIRNALFEFMAQVRSGGPDAAKF